MLGLKHNVNLLVDYDTSWETEFDAERDRIAAALGKNARGIEHYRSTAVVGMRAKPIIDILIGVSPLSHWKLCHDPLIDLGYGYANMLGFRNTTYSGEVEMPPRCRPAPIVRSGERGCHRRSPRRARKVH